MLSNLIMQLQKMYEVHGDIPVLAGFVDQGIDHSWGDDIPYEYLHLFNQITPVLSEAITENFQVENQSFEGIHSLSWKLDEEEHSLSTDLMEQLPYSIQKTLHDQRTKRVLFLYLKEDTPSG